MIIYGVLVLVVGICPVLISSLLFMKKAKVLYTYHYENVKEDKREEFASRLGFSLLISGIAAIVSAILAFVLKDIMAIWVHAIIVFLALGVSLLLVLLFTKKYNGKVITSME